MRVAALYDIHGNPPALEAVLREVYRAGVDRIVVGGYIHMSFERINGRFTLFMNAPPSVGLP